MNIPPFLRLFPVFVTAALLLSPPTQAYASITVVGSPNVKKGRTKVELRAGFSEADKTSSADERVRSRIQIDHGFSDWYAGRLSYSTDKRKNSAMEAESLTLENRFHLLKKETHGFDFGTRLNYTFKDGDKKPDSLSFRLYTRIPVQKWEIRFNQIFDRSIGEMQSPGIELQLEGQITHTVGNGHRFGFESINSFGALNNQNGYSAQDHTFGPVLKGEFAAHSLDYELGYRIGISRAAPDHSFKALIGKSF
jgi:hypothetical protein